MDDTIAWLRKQFDEDEVNASDRHTVGCGYDQIELMADCTCNEPAVARREVVAKHRILTEWEEANRMAEADPDDVSARVARFSFAIALQAIYGVYSDRPGWVEGLAL